MKHKNAEAIIAWANGAEIECKDHPRGNWVPCPGPTWMEYGEYRVKPAAPKWPETTMTEEQLYKVGINSPDRLMGFQVGYLAVANAALAHALETGQVVLPDPERDLRIAKAVHYACNQAIASGSVKSDDLAAIIKEATK